MRARQIKKYMPLQTAKTSTLTAPTLRRRPKVSNAVRDRIVLDHLPLVKAIAVRVHDASINVLNQLE